MKIKTLIAALLFSVVCMGAFAGNKKAAKKEMTPREQLLQRLQKIQQKGYMYGHQDDPFYGIDWEYEDGRSDTKELVGDYPGVMGFDLGGIEVGDAKNLDSVPFKLIREEIIRQHERGGIITISWHPRNPLNGMTAWCGQDTTLYSKAKEYFDFLGQQPSDEILPNPKHTVRAILPGGIRHKLFMTWLERVADFMCQLQDGKGNVIPVIFRPWHEYNGAWFWWGTGNCSAEEYKTLWNMTQDYLNQQLPGQIVWSNSPNLCGEKNPSYMNRWPGDDRVDLFGVDAYQWGTEEDFKQGFDTDLQFVSTYAKEHGLLMAVTECGIQNSPNPVWWSQVMKPIIDKYPVVYFLPWRNYVKEHFGVGPKICTADDFLKVAKDKRVLFVNDIKKIK